MNIEDSCISKPLACRLIVRASTSDVQAVFFWGFGMENFDRFKYDPETGVFTWVSPWKGVRVGDKVGYLDTSNGYLRVAYNRKKYFAHRVAWFIVFGRWPKEQIDHINGNRTDNRISNLREVSNKTNAQNHRTPNKNNTSGYLGVTWHNQMKKWAAGIMVDGRMKHLGLFEDPKLAHEAYKNAKRILHAGCTI